MTRTVKLFLAVAAPVALVLLAAGCGSSGSGSSSTQRVNGSVASTSAATAAANVGAAPSTLGRIVVDGTARTLYLFEKDANGHSACYGACATDWPPLLSHGQPVAGAGTIDSLVGTIQRKDGTKQVTYAGHPLYTYIGDTKPGQTSGEGSQQFGAGWDALSPAGQKIEADG